VKHSLDDRYQPLYTIPEVAGFTRAPVSTLRTWVLGRPSSGHNRRTYPSVLHIGDRRRRDMLNFMNLVETHVLVALRRAHQVPLPKIRSAVKWLRKETGLTYPLAELDMHTDGRDLFVEFFGHFVSASEQGQVVLQDVVADYLRRVERDDHGLPIKFFPFTQAETAASLPKDIVIHPGIAFGRPVLRGTRIPSSIIYERYQSGEGLQEIAQDYDQEVRRIEEALRCENELRAA
jgi:uncharacterized protein (DUF433 family)